MDLHHRHKKDAPSGTALMLGAAAREGRGELRPVVGRHGAMPNGREVQELGYAALRGGDASGEHTVFLLGEGERLELTHRASTPDIFARGALTVAEWLVGRAPGRYQVSDALGLSRV